MARRQGYTDSEMMRMQQDAVARVREMQSRARLTAEESEGAGIPTPPGYSGRNYRNWSTNPNIQRQRMQQVQEEIRQAPSPQREAQREEAPPKAAPPPPPAEPESREPTTLIQDILKAVGLDDDRVLIIGLLFLLINAKADTTLILALIYLLI